MPSFQIIESKRLSEDENLWIKGLSDKLSKDTFFKLYEERKALGFPVRSYFNVIINENPVLISEVKKLDSAKLEQVLEEVGFVTHEKHEEEIEIRDKKIESLDEQVKQLDELVKRQVVKRYQGGHKPEEIIADLGISVEQFIKYIANPPTLIV